MRSFCCQTLVRQVQLQATPVNYLVAPWASAEAGSILRIVVCIVLQGFFKMVRSIASTRGGTHHLCCVGCRTVIACVYEHAVYLHWWMVVMLLHV